MIPLTKASVPYPVSSPPLVSGKEKRKKNQNSMLAQSCGLSKLFQFSGGSIYLVNRETSSITTLPLGKLHRSFSFKFAGPNGCREMTMVKGVEATVYAGSARAMPVQRSSTIASPVFSSPALYPGTAT